MRSSRKKKNSSLAYLRQAITSLPASENLILYLSALMIIIANDRLKHLATTSSKTLSTSDLRKLVHLLHLQLSNFWIADFSGSSIDIDQINEYSDETWTTIWRTLNNKHLDSLWLDETTLGYVYQFLCLPKRSSSLMNLSQSDKTIDTETLVAFTQLYTPGWISEFLVQDTIMPQWNEKVPAEKLTILDPACGAGNFLLQAYNLLVRLYVQEGATEKEATKSIIQHNLFGSDLDTKSLAVTALVLLIRCLKTGAIGDLKLLTLHPAARPFVDQNRQTAMMGSLNRDFGSDHPLGKKHRVVVTNPPYIGRKLLDRQLKQLLKLNYPNSRNDLANAFLERCLELTDNSGMVGLITQSSILSLPSYKDLRKSILDSCHIETCVELGPGVFPLQGGEKINSLMLVLKNTPCKEDSKHAVRFIDLTKTKEKAYELEQIDTTKNEYQVKQHLLRQNNNCVFNYRCPPVVSNFLKQAAPLANTAEIRQGLATTNNHRFLRFWWDVDSASIGERWFPYAKGAGVRRWHNPIRHVVNWQNNGAEIKEAVTSAYPYLNGKSAWVVKNEKYYFRQGLTFSFIGGQDLSVRYLTSGCIFDVAGSAIFVEDQSIFSYLAYLNSSFIRAVARNLNPSINFQVGDLKKLPVLDFSKSERIELAAAAQKCFAIKQWLNGFDPTVFSNTLPEELADVLRGQSIEESWNRYNQKHQQSTREIEQIEESINSIVLAALSRYMSQSELRSVTDWLERECPTAHSESPLNSNEFIQISLYHLISEHLKEHTSLTFDLNAKDFPFLTKENFHWVTKQMGRPIEKYLIEQFTIDQAKQFSGSPYLFCRQVEGNGHAILFSSQTVRDLAQKKPSTQRTMDISILTSLASKVAHTKDWTGKDLLNSLA